MNALEHEKAMRYVSLWAACFLQAINDCWDEDKDSLIRDPAREWVKNKSNDPTGFSWVCSIFDLDPDRTSDKILSSRTTLNELKYRVAKQVANRKKQLKDDKIEINKV